MHVYNRELNRAQSHGSMEFTQKSGVNIRHSVIVELNIPSYRVEHAKQKQQAENQAEGEGGGPA